MDEVVWVALRREAGTAASSRTARRQIVGPFGSPKLGLSHMPVSVGCATLAGLLLAIEGVMDHPRR